MKHSRPSYNTKNSFQHWFIYAGDGKFIDSYGIQSAGTADNRMIAWPKSLWQHNGSNMKKRGILFKYFAMILGKDSPIIPWDQIPSARRLPRVVAVYHTFAPGKKMSDEEVKAQESQKEASDLETAKKKFERAEKALKAAKKKFEEQKNLPDKEKAEKKLEAAKKKFEAAKKKFDDLKAAAEKKAKETKK